MYIIAGIPNLIKINFTYNLDTEAVPSTCFLSRFYCINSHFCVVFEADNWGIWIICKYKKIFIFFTKVVEAVYTFECQDHYILISAILLLELHIPVAAGGHRTHWGSPWWCQRAMWCYTPQHVSLIGPCVKSMIHPASDVPSTWMPTVQTVNKNTPTLCYKI